MKKYGLYIHIPFCIQKCNYCDFNSYAGKLELSNAYVNALIKEAQLYKDLYIDTVFIGGGTPTCLSTELLLRLINGIFNTFKIEATAEATIEANPGTLSISKLRVLRSSGINRLSLGVQSLDDKQLKLIGRMHSSDDVYTAFDMATAAGFTNISCDMMFGLPTQTLKNWMDDINKIIKLPISHISCYSLKIEEGTDFANRKINPASDKLDRSMYHNAVMLLDSNGFSRYEISNLAKKGYESLHNLKYWQCKEYIGLGAGAHSYMDSVRYSNIASPEQYIKEIEYGQTAVCEKNPLSEQDKTAEQIILGLRLAYGIDQSLVMNLPDGKAKLNKLITAGLIKELNKRLYLTDRGIDLSNSVFVEFI